MSLVRKIINMLSKEEVTTIEEDVHIIIPEEGDKLLDTFLEIWIVDNTSRDYTRMAKDTLTDNEYIIYTCWCQLNENRLYKEYLPNTTIISGSMDRTDKIIFHGGCQGCVSQEVHGVNRCKGCAYFQFDFRTKEDISIKGGENRQFQSSNNKELN